MGREYHIPKSANGSHLWIWGIVFHFASLSEHSVLLEDFQSLHLQCSLLPSLLQYRRFERTAHSSSRQPGGIFVWDKETGFYKYVYVGSYQLD